MMLAALAGHSSSLGALGGLAGSLVGGRTSADLSIESLGSDTVAGHLIDRFDLQHVYRKRYRRASRLLRTIASTKITEEKKSGVITIEVEDTDPLGNRHLAQGYLDELNQLVVKTDSSAAHRERVFIAAAPAFTFRRP